MQSPSSTPLKQEALFLRWWNEHRGLMIKIVRGCAEKSSDQDDLLQDILLQLWYSIPAFRQECKESTWIYRVAFNTALAWRRNERKHRQGYEAIAQLAASPSAPLSPESNIVEQLYSAIRRLSKVDASLAMMHLDELSYREISEVLGISENHVGVKLTRIRHQLATQLKGVRNGL